MGSAASTSSDDCDAKPRAVIVCHNSQELSIKALIRANSDKSEGDNVDHIIILTNSSPRDRQLRAEVLSCVQAAFVAVDPMLQRSAELIETLSYLKDQRKIVISGSLNFFSRPSGAIGAVCLALSQWDPLLFADTERFAYWAEQYALLSRSKAGVETDKCQDMNCCDTGAPSNVDAPEIPHVVFVYCNDVSGDASRVVEHFAHNDSVPGGLSLAGEIIVCQHNLENDLAAIRTASVVVFVITEACTTADDAANHFRQLFECTIAWNKPFLPIKEQRAILQGWLALAMAGRLWYQVDATKLELADTPYADISDCPCKVKDSCLATDFVLCANGLLSTPRRTLERAQISSYEDASIRFAKQRAQALGLSADVVESICERVKNLVNSFSNENDISLAELHDSFGVATSREAVEYETTASQEILKPEDLLPQEESEANKALRPLADIHYEVTRVGFVPPPAVLDNDGLPIVGLQLDVMFSYQWGSQAKVLDIHQQGQVHNLRAWFDVYGHMQGNVNSAMAAAVESVACMVIFLTKFYLASVNCRLEFEYAARCRKPMIFAFLEDPATLELPAWVLSVAGTKEFNVYPSLVRETSSEPSRVLALDMRADRVRGVPMTAVLFGAIRRLAAWRSRSLLPILYDGSLLLYATTSALHHAVAGKSLANDSSETGEPKTTSTLCSRCGALFSPGIPASLEGCRHHTSYYVGGSLIAGRWACCQEPQSDGPGCHPAQHMAVERKWTLDPSYGTYTYEPNPDGSGF